MSSESKVEIVQLGKIGSHPNADSLDITTVHGGYPCIVRKGEFQPGDKCVYIPVDMVVPLDNPQFAFLGKHNRIKAKKLRGIFSMGLLIPLPAELADSPVGADVSLPLSIHKYIDPLEVDLTGECERDPGFIPTYTDIESCRKYGAVLTDGEDVVITEKLHGANIRFCYHKDRLWVGSHHQIKKEGGSMWWEVARQYDLSERLRAAQGKVFYAEIYGWIQNLRYGTTGHGQFMLAFYDVYDIATGTYMNYDDAGSLLKDLDLPSVPVLYRGPWMGIGTHKDMAEGNTAVPNADNIKEGFVVKPTIERFHPTNGRVILKYHGEGYLLQKSK